FAVITGGGTAGHVVPALAIAEALVARGHEPAELRFVGSRRGMEARLVPEAGFHVTLLPGRGVPRRLGLAAAQASLQVAAASALALPLMARLSPRVVISVGGYAAAPAALAAVLLRVPLVICEQNAVPGAVNRLAAPFAAASATAHPGTGLSREVVTGNPVRRSITLIERTEEARRSAKERLGIPRDAKLVGAVSGSLGARRINDACIELAALWRQRDDVALRQVTGVRDFERVMSISGTAGGALHQVVAYEQDMATFLTACDVVVSRAGGSAAELTCAGIPSILVPLPGAPGDHQGANARFMAAQGAAVMVKDAELTGTRLATELGRLLGNPHLLGKMEAHSLAIGRPGAAGAVAELAESVALKVRLGARA
ncbi:MAG: UDP-N-acetylglucosamine--N-acetylmuramyl-(pentapeptide) pyrophosphoryl-undecaprenol N-acetylglucosamine transferase, partial [Acidimicrobiales bacterium]